MPTNLLTQNLEFVESKFNNVEYLNLIKSGKEADVHLLKVESKLMALKIYKEFTKFSSRLEYFPTASMTSKRLKKALEQKSNAGQRLMRNLWTEREFRAMKKLKILGANVPEVYEFNDEAILMEYIGTLEAPAPRLSDIILSKDLAKSIFDEVVKNIDIFMQLGIVHGDLSEYNILLFEDRAVIIDFPQFIETNNPNITEKLIKDITNVINHFSKYQVDTRELDKKLNDFLMRLSFGAL
jgi:RIO kinase 1